MRPAPASQDPEVRAEQEYLDQAHMALAAMRRRAGGLLDDLRGAGNPDLDYQAALVRRVNLLADSPRPLLFGRIDEEAGPSWHIGRRHVEDQRGDPVVVDFGATYEGYRSDMTRTFCVGAEPEGDMARVFAVVGESQAAGFNHHLVKPVDLRELEALLDSSGAR